MELYQVLMMLVVVSYTTGLGAYASRLALQLFVWLCRFMLSVM
jgi:hypothetical protein